MLIKFTTYLINHFHKILFCVLVLSMAVMSVYTVYLRHEINVLRNNIQEVKVELIRANAINAEIKEKLDIAEKSVTEAKNDALVECHKDNPNIVSGVVKEGDLIDMRCIHDENEHVSIPVRKIEHNVISHRTKINHIQRNYNLDSEIITTVEDIPPAHIYTVEELENIIP